MTGRPNDDESLEQLALEQFFDTDGERLCQGRAEGEYLRNRIWRAFTAGLQAGASIERARVLERLQKVVEGRQ